MYRKTNPTKEFIKSVWSTIVFFKSSIITLNEEITKINNDKTFITIPSLLKKLYKIKVIKNFMKNFVRELLERSLIFYEIKHDKRKFGKEVTLVEFGEKHERNFLKNLLKELKRSLGCGGTILDSKTLLLQGNHKRERIEKIIENFLEKNPI